MKHRCSGIVQGRRCKKTAHYLINNKWRCLAHAPRAEDVSKRFRAIHKAVVALGELAIEATAKPSKEPRHKGWTRGMFHKIPKGYTENFVSIMKRLKKLGLELKRLEFGKEQK